MYVWIIEVVKNKVIQVDVQEKNEKSLKKLLSFKIVNENLS